MDIERYKRIAASKDRAGNATKAVRDTLKDVEYSKQDQYEERGEVFKPIIDSQEEIKGAVDKKQDELIKRLREGQDEIVKAIDYDPKKVKAPKSLIDLGVGESNLAEPLVGYSFDDDGMNYVVDNYDNRLTVDINGEKYNVKVDAYGVMYVVDSDGS